MVVVKLVSEVRASGRIWRCEQGRDGQLFPRDSHRTNPSPPPNQTPLAILVRQRSRRRSVPVVGRTQGLASGSRLERGIRPSRRVPVDTSQPSQRLQRLWIGTRVATARRWPTWRVGSPPNLGVPVDTHRSRQIAEGHPTHRTREDEQTLAERNHHSDSCC